MAGGVLGQLISILSSHKVLQRQQLINYFAVDGMATEATLQQRVEQQVLRALQEKEAALDAALQQQQQGAGIGSSTSRDGVTQEEADEELQALREKRKRQLQREMQLRVREGYGSVLEISDEKEFFEVAKKSNKVIATFCRPSSRPCEVTLARLREFAARNLDIRCLHLNAEKSPFLCERLKIWCLPTMVLIQDGQTSHSIVGLDELGGNEFTVEDLERAVGPWLKAQKTSQQ